MSDLPLSEVQQEAADDVLDVAENFLHSLAANGDGQSVRAAFYACFLDTLDAFTRTRRNDA